MKEFSETAKRLQQYKIEPPRQETSNSLQKAKRLQQYKIETAETRDSKQSTESQENDMS